ncbi:hypothetical protein CYLTODRAFT_256972 [Cylindrobasidium torrendii FP15055 ss-10]|uniref:Uncharacterized protein n=1 Tax=Cylindrobasidium torrendii FP15055 ss-10 TaxID=1314674 RepID=A0A0D7BSM4_9AGAR|nr:hypothetical protein CYLTODRAFT_256972 [Cylindrobasidium torrendii FP15055 ss-10]
MEQFVRIRRNVAFDLTRIDPTRRKHVTDNLEDAREVSIDQKAARRRGVVRATRYNELAQKPGTSSTRKQFYSRLATAVTGYSEDHGILMSQSLTPMLQWIKFFNQRHETQYLSRLLEEPARAKADMVAGIRIPNVLSSDNKASAERIRKFSMLVEAGEPQPVQTVSQDITFSEVFRPGLEQAAVPSNPLALRMPDPKDMAELCISGLEDEPPRSYGPRTSLSSSTASVMGDNEESFERQAEFCATEQHGINLSTYMAEHKKDLDQTEEDCTLAAVGIFDFPIFCTASDGPKGLIYAAWATKPDGQDQYIVYIAMHNAPVFDLTKPMHALRFSLFLLHLRFTHEKKLRARFEDVRKSFEERWQRQEKSLDWTLDDQKAEHQDAMDKHKERMKKAQALIDTLSNSLIPVATSRSSASRSSRKSGAASSAQDASTQRGRQQPSRTRMDEGVRQEQPRTRSMSKASRQQ